eukprot:6492066-Amphidinium_carterae.1
MNTVSRNARINPNLVFISGFSAGAYACIELLALGLDFPVAAMVFGGVHGHGNSPEICANQQLGQLGKLRIPEYNGKWQAYLRRLALPASSEVRTVVAVHNERDTLSPWIPAKEIIQAIDASRVWEDATPVRVVSFIKERSRKDKCAHQYWLLVVDELFEEILVARSHDHDANIEKVAAKKLKAAAKEKDKGVAVTSSSSLSSSSTSLLEKPLDPTIVEVAGMDLATIDEEKVTRACRPVEVAPQLVLQDDPQIEDEVRVLILPRPRARRFSSQYTPPTQEELDSLRAALFSALPPTEYLQRAARRQEAPEVVNKLELHHPSLEPKPQQDEQSLRGIFGLIGPTLNITLLLPPPEDMPFMDTDTDVNKQSCWITVEKAVCLRTSASIRSPVIGTLEQFTLLRVIGNPRYNRRLLCARVEVLSHDSHHCGVVAYTVLKDDGPEGRPLCKLVGDEADQYLRNGRLHPFQWGMTPTVMDASYYFDAEDPDPEPIAQETLDMLISMLVAALPLKEHLQGLAKADTQAELPMNKAEKEGYIEIPLGYIVFASPWSNTVSFGGFAEEVVPVDIRHTGAGHDLLGWWSTSCYPSLSSCSRTSSFWFPTLTLSGGVRGAIPLPTAVGWGADGDTRHVIQNAQDLVTFQADHPGPEESQPEFEGNSTQPFHDDERIAIYVGLRRILSDLWALCMPMTHQAQADLVAYQSVETTLESHHSVFTDSSGSRHERITDYDPSLPYSSQIVEWNGSNLTQSILSAFSTDFDDDGELEGDEENMPFGGLIFTEPHTLDMEEQTVDEDDYLHHDGITFAGGGKTSRKPIGSSCSLPSSSWETYIKKEFQSSPSCATHQSEGEDKGLGESKLTNEIRCNAINSRIADLFLSLPDSVIDVSWLRKSIASKKHLAQPRITIVIAGEPAQPADILFLPSSSVVHYFIEQPL